MATARAMKGEVEKDEDVSCLVRKGRKMVAPRKRKQAVSVSPFSPNRAKVYFANFSSISFYFTLFWKLMNILTELALH